MKYSENVVEMAPSAAARMMRSSDHPKRKAGRRPHDSRMNTYTPPVRESSSDLGDRERAAEREDPADDPDREERQRTRQLVGDSRRRAKNARAYRRADENCN